MATGHNTWILDGRLAYEPELRTTPQGIQVCTLRLCWSKKVGSRKASLFVNAVCWRALTQTAARYLHKGELVGVEGEAIGTMQTKQDGHREYVIEIKVGTLVFFPQTGKHAGERVEITEANAAGYPGDEDVPPVDDTLPF